MSIIMIGGRLGFRILAIVAISFQATIVQVSIAAEPPPVCTGQRDVPDPWLAQQIDEVAAMLKATPPELESCKKNPELMEKGFRDIFEGRVSSARASCVEIAIGDTAQVYTCLENLPCCQEAHAFALGVLRRRLQSELKQRPKEFSPYCLAMVAAGGNAAQSLCRNPKRNCLRGSPFGEFAPLLTEVCMEIGFSALSSCNRERSSAALSETGTKSGNAATQDPQTSAAEGKGAR